jgi:predicted phosphodiesterase
LSPVTPHAGEPGAQTGSALDDLAALLCKDRFAPPKLPTLATDHNGVQLADTCFRARGPNKTNHVFVIGDWGGIGVSDPVPADDRLGGRPFVPGVDEKAQHRVAEQMQKLAEEVSPDYVINVGDNFYFGGLNWKCGGAPDQCKDFTGQWFGIFENIYKGAGIDDVQWLGVLGNHDYGGFIFTAAWDQVISYTWTTGFPSTGRWLTPAQYWRSKVRYDGFSVDYFFVDSNVYGTTSPYEQEHNICSTTHNLNNISCGKEGPTSVEDCPKWFQRLWEEQDKWLQAGLANSTADWQIVVTHYPPDVMQSYWKELSTKHGIDLIICGHTHTQLVHYAGIENSFWPTAVVVSGGGGGITSAAAPDINGNDDSYGFMDLEFTKTAIVVKAISHGGVLRSTTSVRPRHSHTQLHQRWMARRAFANITTEEDATYVYD